MNTDKDPLKPEPELKPCAHCGGKASSTLIGNDHTKERMMSIQCVDCRVQIKNKALKLDIEWLKGITIKTWNTRTPVEAAQEEDEKEPEGAHIGSDNRCYLFNLDDEENYFSGKTPVEVIRKCMSAMKEKGEM